MSTECNVGEKRKCLVGKNSSNPLLGGRKRRAITLATKLEVVAAVQGGEKMCNVARRLGFPESTVRSIMHNRESIIESTNSHQSTDTLEEVYQSRTRLGVLEETENQLSIWIRAQAKEMNFEEIQSKAVQIYQELKGSQQSTSESTREFKASRHWFDRFLKRYRLTLSENGSSNNVTANGCEKMVGHQTSQPNGIPRTYRVQETENVVRPPDSAMPSMEDLREIFLTVNRFEHFLLSCDPDIERVTCVLNGIRDATHCYQQLLLSSRHRTSNTTNNHSNSNESELYLEPIVSLKCENGFDA